MDNLIACYAGKLNTESSKETDALSNIVLLHEVLNAELEKKELNLQILLKDETTGIIPYLRNLSTKRDVSRDLTNELSNLLKCIIVDFTDVSTNYISPIVEKFCEPAIIYSQSTNLKVMALELLLLLFKTPGINYFSKNPDRADKLYGNLLFNNKGTSSEKKVVYQLLGEIVDYNPSLFNTTRRNQLFRLLSSEIRKQLQQNSNFRVNELEGLYDCLQLYLKNFHEENCVTDSTDLYYFVKEGCGMEVQHRKGSIRAAFKIFENQFDLFAENVFKDYDWWAKLFEKFLASSNKDDQHAAFHASSAFYRGISKILKKKMNPEILKYFLESLRSSMKKSNNLEVALAAENYGHFAKVCKHYNENKELERMFALTFQIAENCCSGQIDDNIELRHMSSMLVSMAKIAKHLYSKNSSEDELAIVGKFSAFVFITSPKVPNNFRFFVKKNLIRTIIILSDISDTVLDSYLEKLIFTSLIKCCSCPLERDIEFMTSLGETKNTNLVSCKDYIPLWKTVCNIEKELIENKIVSEKRKFETIREKNLPSKVFDVFIKNVLSILEKLDFSDIKDDDDDNDTNERTSIMDNDGPKLKMESDFFIFVNLVEVYSSVISVCELNHLEKWIPELIKVFIKLSASSPIKSGFFQLLAVIFQRVEAVICYEQSSSILKSFLIETVITIGKFEGVDLNACLRMLLKIPPDAVQMIINYIIPILQVVFTQGLEDLSLARSGLEALQNWGNSIEPSKFRPILETIIPLLNPYLESKKSVGDTDTLTKYEERLLTPALTTKNKVYKKFYNMSRDSSNTDLLKFQREILEFLSEIEVDLCKTIYNPEKQSTNEFTKVLRFLVPFRNGNVNIFLDKFLPRVIELTNHSNLKMRVTACEMLHSMTLVFLGNTIRRELSKPMENIFRQLVTRIFRLGSDDNLVIKLMFTQLSHQLVRYYSREYENVTALLLEILFESVSHMHDISLKHFGAKLIGEFVRGSLKDRSDDGTSTHILAVVKYICLFSVQPCAFRRQGAALAFNNIYRELRESENLVNTYWIELLVHFIRSSSMNVDNQFDDDETSRSLQHIRRVLLQESRIFLKSDSRRRVPKCLKDGTLQSVIIWMLQKCCISENKLCRNKSMELVVDLCCKLPEIDSLDRFFGRNTEQENDLLDRIFSHLLVDENFLNFADSLHSSKDEFFCAEISKRTILWLRSLLAGLHCLSWLLKEAIVACYSSTSDLRFMRTMKFYGEFILPNSLSNYLETRSAQVKSELIPADLNPVYETLKYEVFHEYLIILIVCNTAHFEDFIGDEEWQTYFWQTFISYLFASETFAINSVTHKCITSAIPKILSKLQEISADKQEMIYQKIRENPTHELFDTFVENIENCHFVSLNEKQYISALNELQKSGMIPYIFPNVKERKQKILQRLFEYVKSGSRAKSCNPAITMQLEGLLEFALADFEVNFVLDLLATSSTLIVSHSVESTISQGRHFFSVFRKPIAEFLSRYLKDLVDNYILPHLLTKEKLQIVIDCLKFFNESSKSINADQLVEGVFMNWSSLICWSPNDDCSRYLFSLIDAIVIKKELPEKLSADVKYPVFLWLINNLLREENFLTGGKEYFRLLTPFISESNQKNDTILRTKLKEFRDKYFEPSSPNKLKEAEYINTFKALLSLFCNSENVIVLDALAAIEASNADEKCDGFIQQTLESVMKKVPTENQLKFLNTIFALFKDSRKIATFRLGCVQKFLIPLLYSSKVETLKIFFSAEMDYVLQTLKEPIEKAQESNAEKETILLKTAAVCVAEVFSYCECEEIMRTVSAQGPDGGRTVKNTIGRELFGIVVKSITLRDRSNASALRVLKCYCYNTLIKTVQKTPRDAKYYANIFNENPRTRSFIWQSIIDLNEEISLRMYIDELPARKKALKQKRKELKTKNAMGTTMRSIPSQYLSTSSLVSSVKYDMSEWNISNEGYLMQVDNKSYTIDLEEDKLNNHECMTTVCELILFIVESNISPLPDLELNPVPELPLFMENLKHSLKFALRSLHKNVILFLFKMIHNCKVVFRPYAAGWIDLIIDCLLMLDEVNYLTIDMIVMMISWCEVYTPTNKEKNDRLLTLVLKNIDQEETSVRNYRLELLRTFIKFWYQYIEVPFARLSSIFNRVERPEKLEVCLTMAKAFLLRGILPFKEEDSEAVRFSSFLMFHVNRNDTNRALKILNFEVQALILEVAKTKNVLTTCSPQIEKSLFEVLTALRVDNTKTKTDLFFSCLDHTLQCFPSILHRFLVYLLQGFIKFQGKIKAQCLHMLTLDAVPDDTFSKLMHMQFDNCLRDSNHEIVKNALIVLKKFVNTSKVDDLRNLLADIVRLSSHPVSECRQLVYEIADSVYERYKNEENDVCRRVKSQCQVILLNGLLDSDKALQEKIFKSWKERCNLSDQIVERFISIVTEMYSPENESRFVNYATDFLLDACSETTEFNSNIFDNPLSGSSVDFREQDFTPLSMLRNKHSIAPMFLNSLSNQLVEASLFSTKMCTLVLPGSQKKLFFKPSQDTGGTSGGTPFTSSRQWSVGSSSLLEDYSKIQPEIRKLQNRLQPSQRRASEFHARRNVEKREERIEILKTRSERVEKNIQFSRKYRDGEFPDIEIPRSAVVNPLKILGKKDPVIAKLIFISIFDGMLSGNPNKKKHLKAIGSGFNEILKSTFQHSSLIETIFETVFYHPDDLKLESQRVVISSHASGLLSLGSLILENSLQAEMLSTSTEYGAKRMKVDDSVYRTKWVQLAELYKALDKNDIVNGILKEKIEGKATETLKSGLAFEQLGEWEKACDVYEKEINQLLSSNVRSFEEHFIFEAYLKCAANLSKWVNVKDMITKKFQNLDDLWLESWDIEHTLPWFFTAEAIICVQQDGPSEDGLDTIKRWLGDEEKNAILKNLITESMAILLFLNGENIEAKHKIQKSIESMLQNWSHSTASLNKFYKLLTLSEIDSMLHPYKVSQGDKLSSDACRRVLKMWSSNTPRCDNLYWWDKRVEYRVRFSSKYVLQLDEEDEEALNCIADLAKYKTKSCLQMSEVALQLQNAELADKYYTEAQYNANEDSITIDFETQLTLNKSKVFLLCANKSDKHTKFVDSLNTLAERTWTEQLYSYYMHVADSIRILETKWGSFTPDIKQQLIVLLRKVLDQPRVDADTVHAEMQEAVINYYKEASTHVENSKSPHVETAAAFLSLAKYSRTLFDDRHNDENLVHKENYIRSILKALKFDSREAQLLFPTLLQLEQITNETLKSVFVSESLSVEEWKFLVWIQQLLAHIDTDKLPLIEKLLSKIIEKYPNAIQFSFFSSDLMRYDYKNDAAMVFAEKLRQTLNQNSEIASFVKALSCIRVPENYFYYYMKKISRAFQQSDFSLLSSIKKEIYSDNAEFKGRSFTENKWWKRIKKLLENVNDQSSPTSSVRTEIHEYLETLKKENDDMRRNCDKREYKFLNNYSYWFNNFGDLPKSNIEIPGQYDGFVPPNPSRHVRVFEFDTKNVKIQTSVQLPIKIRMTGDDGKKYSYLVKFGEDTRQDQRIQQIFSIMNRCSDIKSEAVDGGDNVSVITYGVFPLTTYFGLIEWVEDTIVLREFMDYHLQDSEKKESKDRRGKLGGEYNMNICRYNTNLTIAHEEAVKNFCTDLIVPTFERLRNQIPRDVFKKSILALCNSPIMYWNLRNQFMVSYCTLCIYGWILGIGDRHLGNFLVCLKSGRCVAIDFGHAFGTATTYQEIPELIPFRMTPHIEDIMLPFGLTGLIRETMVNALKTIRTNEYILFAAMQIFLLDPSFNWLKSIKRKRVELRGIDETGVQWYSADKIKRIKRKLLGINPAKILQEELEDNLIISTGYRDGCIRLLNREGSRRSTLSHDDISLADQIDCLLEIATDKCILGVSYCGLETYI